MDWWTPGQAGIWGGIAGGVVGILGAAIGTIAGFGARKGKGKTAVSVLLLGMVAFGVACIALSIAALLSGQPYHVWYLPGLLGVLSAGLGGVSLFIVRVAYAQAEQRRLAAEELRRC